MEEKVRIEVVLAAPDRQALLVAEVSVGTSVEEAVDRSGIATEFPDIDIKSLNFGVWGRLVDKSRLVKDGDRIEIYRPLHLDPREARRQIAVEGGVMGGQSPDAAGD